MTERTFGKKEESVTYTDRPGAYLIAIQDGVLHVVRTKKDGYLLLPGGDLKADESHETCIVRECMEKTGYLAEVKDWITSADTYCIHPTVGYCHLIQTYYSGSFSEQIAPPADDSAEHLTLKLSDLENLYIPMQKWAVEQCIEMLRLDAHGSDDEDL